MKLVPRVIRGMNSPRALFYTRKPRRLTRLEGKATVQQGKEGSGDLVGM
jgi:hypothetical protein